MLTLTTSRPPAAHASRYDVELSDDGAQWRTVRKVLDGRGGPDVVWLSEAEAQFVRLVLHAGPAPAYGLAELEIKDVGFGISPNTVFEMLARVWPADSGGNSGTPALVSRLVLRS